MQFYSKLFHKSISKTVAIFCHVKKKSYNGGKFLFKTLYFKPV